MQDAVTTTIAVAKSPTGRRSAIGCALSCAIVFPFLVVGAIWEIVAWAGIFPRRLFPDARGSGVIFRPTHGHGNSCRTTRSIP